MGKLYKNRVRLNNPRAVCRLLARVVNGVLHDEISEEKARVVGYLCNSLLKGFEAGEFEERLAELEKALLKEAG